MSTFSNPAAHSTPDYPPTIRIEPDSGKADSGQASSGKADFGKTDSGKAEQWVKQLLAALFPNQMFSGHYLSQLLQQRNIAPPTSAPTTTSAKSAKLAKPAKSTAPFDRHCLSGFLHPDHYQPTSPFAFGDEMYRAIARLQQARDRQERITIWGDFDADGLTATAVLWDGLRQFFPAAHLSYTIPNRLTESHGLNKPGLDRLAQQSCNLIITCDTGSTNLEELAYAHTLGIDVIITDHHTLADKRPSVVAQINPRTLPADHSLAHLSGVAVAYKLVEALYETLPDVPQQPLDRLLDLVAIGLITDLVELKGDCRYLAQRGIQQLQSLLTQQPPSRPGIAQLLQLCKRTGDRPTDISFGIGPRINAISRIHGDATFAIELLTRQDDDTPFEVESRHRCRQLAEKTELANSRRKALQRDVMNQVVTRLADLDLSTTQVIVLADPQWSIGVLGLVAGQIAQDYHRPTILLSIPSNDSIARGSARSVENINLYDLVKGQSQILHRFGGHPFAAGLSISVDNLPLFRDSINQAFRTQYGDLAQVVRTSPRADLTVTVAELGQDLFRELKLLEPCGMGNPVPRLLIQNCEFKGRSHRNIKDLKGGKLRYIKTDFRVCDRTCPEGFPGTWWGHYQDELPEAPCNAIVELDFNSYECRYETRLLDLCPSKSAISFPQSRFKSPTIIDQRPNAPTPQHPNAPTPQPIPLTQCPRNWTEWEKWLQKSAETAQTVAIAFSLPTPSPPIEIWKHLVGIAKYLSRTQTSIDKAKLANRLGIGDRALARGLNALTTVGFNIQSENTTLFMVAFPASPASSTAPAPSASSALLTSAVPDTSPIQTFLNAIQEEQFQQRYFTQAALDTLEDALK